MTKSRFPSSILLASVLLAGFGSIAWVAGEEHAMKNEHTTLALVWYQNAAECRALYYQAFNTARLVLDNDLKNNKPAKKRAIVVDVDETILDNSPHSVMLLKEDKSFPFRWDEWIDAAKAEALPGSVAFLSYAVSRGVDVYYISNRTTAQLSSTIKNLKSAGFPLADEQHVILKDKESSKEGRRNAVASDHEIVLLMGDNLNDFSNVFERKNTAERFGEADKAKDKFGSKFIVLPNPVYGEWEGALYDYNFKISDQEKDSKRKAALRAF